ncbi:MAG: ABC transporter ATP-binding protein/permease [Oscillospiraceae bacterium]|nr:ABC transporter ATP-binding protein/permease [Oscillospiraceae bacterium]
MDFLRLFKKHWQCAHPEQWRVAWYLFWHVFSVSGQLCKPYAFAMALNCLQTGQLSEAGKWLAWYVIGFAVFEIGHRLARSTERYLAFRNRKRFVLSAYDKLQGLPLSWHSNHHSANVIDRINKAADALFGFGQCQSAYIEVIVNLIGASIFLWVLSPVVAVVGCAAGILSIYITKWLYKKSVPEYRAQNELFHKLAAALMDYISNITTIIVLRLGRRARIDLEDRIDEIFPHLVREHRVTQVKCFLNALLMVALNVGMIAYYIYSRSAAGAVIMVGSVAAVFQYLDILMGAFGFYTGDYEYAIHWWQDYNAAAMIIDEDSSSAMPGSKIMETIPANWRTLNVNKIDFAYGDGQAELHCDSIELGRGKRIAFVGESGAGKSTCLNILRGLLPVNGNIAVDGAGYLQICALGDIATLVSQEPEIFENTIKYNITLGLPATKEEIEAAAYAACFGEVALSIPNGYEADIRENGVNLSGGEKQRLALARGVLAMRESSLILLDEPTGSLDAETETKIYQRLFAMFPDACIVSTLHRLHLLPMFDCIYVFQNGRIAEMGSFGELKDSGGILSKLWNIYQSGNN